VKFQSSQAKRKRKKKFPPEIDKILGRYIKASLHLAHESILFLVKDSKQSLAFPLKENETT
jgi:hypothetical protein